MALAKLNRLIEAAWGPLAPMSSNEARQIIALGSIRYRFEVPVYGDRTFARFHYSVADVLVITQRMFAPKIIELPERAPNATSSAHHDCLIDEEDHFPPLILQ
jgi:hypothetical protein